MEGSGSHGAFAGGQKPADETSEQIACRMQLIAHKIMVLSGKGGVGKSTVAANLAVSLAAAGRRTGLLDIDIHGPSIPKLLGLEGRLLPGPAEMLLPLSFNENLKVMSIGFLLPDDREAVIWRGPMKHKIISQFLAQVEWGELDYLVVDSPPGTGDEPLSIAQLVHGGGRGRRRHHAARGRPHRRSEMYLLLSPGRPAGDRRDREHERLRLPPMRGALGAFRRRGWRAHGTGDECPVPGEAPHGSLPYGGVRCRDTHRCGA